MSQAHCFLAMELALTAEAKACPPGVPVLTLESLHEASAILAGRDPDLGRVVAAIGPPPLWEREPGFATLVYIILEQQVSLASARAAYNRLSAAINPISPANFLFLDDETLKAYWFQPAENGLRAYSGPGSPRWAAQPGTAGGAG